MKKVVRLIIACIVTSWTHHATATLIASEDFDYSAGPINGQNGGSGFTAAWVSATDEQVTSGSLSGVGLSPFGNKLEISAATVTRTANFTSLNLKQSATNYFSILVNKGGSESVSGENAAFKLMAGSSPLSGFSISSDERVQVNTRLSASNSAWSATAIDVDTTYLFVMKLVTAPTVADEFSVAWFKAGDVIPTSPDDISWLSYSYANDYNSAVTQISIQSGSLVTTTIDAFKLSSDYADVIPEPATIGLYIISSLGLFLFRHAGR